MIIICEPQCNGFEHAEVNAAFVAVAANAYSGEEVLFLGEAEHVKIVKENLKRERPAGVKYAVIKVPPRRLSTLRRFPAELALCRKVFQRAVDNGENRVMFTSVSSAGLIAIKTMQRVYRQIKVHVVLHGILERINEPPALLSPKRLIWFRYLLVRGNNRNIRYLVLGPTIKKALVEGLPRLEPWIDSIDLPYLYKEVEGYKPFTGRVRFGFFGVATVEKGAQRFFKMAREVQGRKTCERPEFLLIGHIKDEEIKSMDTNSVLLPSPDTPLTRIDYDDYARSVDYAVFFYGPDSYRLRASGALFDAFSFVKPIISLRNPFFEHYFEQMGDIGYLCNDYAEMKETIVSILNNPPLESYEKQRQNLVKGRGLLECRELGRDFKAIWEKG